MGIPGVPAQGARSRRGRRPVVDITRDLGISAQSIYTWRRQDRIDKGFEPDLSSAEKAELTSASTGSRSWMPSWRSPQGQRAAREGGAPKGDSRPCHAWLLDQIRDVHAASNGTYGARRVHAELTLGRGLLVGHNAVEMLGARAGIRGVTGRPRWRVRDRI